MPSFASPLTRSVVTRRKLLPLLAGLALTFPFHHAAADIIPEGHRGITHEIFIEGGDRFPDWKFVLYPTHFGSPPNWREIKPDEAQRFYHVISPKVYAFKLGAPEPVSEEAFKDESIPRSEAGVILRGVVPDADPTRRIRTVYRITGVTGNRVGVTTEPDQRFDEAGQLLSPSADSARVESRNQWLIGTGAGIIVVLAAIGLLRSRRGDSPPPAGA